MFLHVGLQPCIAGSAVANFGCYPMRHCIIFVTAIELLVEDIDSINVIKFLAHLSTKCSW